VVAIDPAVYQQDVTMRGLVIVTLVVMVGVLSEILDAQPRQKTGKFITVFCKSIFKDRNVNTK